MPYIRKLSPAVANQIAAGEVIERPSNACKELVENAIDAGARRIKIEIEQGGKKLIKVSDDGIGMAGEDAVLSLQRHATSKLRDSDDLYAVRTLGFRGEALPSIAAVARLELTSRQPDAAAGTRLVVEAGVVTEASEVGCAAGTVVEVRDLFFNTPARFKFLKSDSAEAGRINELVGHLALAYPEIAFKLRNNGNEVLRSEGGGGALNALVCVLGREIARQMLPVATSQDPGENGAQVSGFVGRPQLTRGNRNGQVLFVNGRVIKNRTLQHAIGAAYEGLLHGHDRFPMTVLFLHVPPNTVDVNVHPTKSEVRFAREWEIHHALRVAVRETLAASQLAPDWGFAPVRGPVLTGPFGSTPGVSASAEEQPLASGVYGGNSYPGSASTYNDRAVADAHLPYPTNGAGYSAYQNALPAMPQPLHHEEQRLCLRPLGQISNNAYILCEGSDGLYIVCQHRAHERILADKAIGAAEGRPVESQRLIIPFTAELGPRAAAAVEENTSLLQDLGFEVDGFGGASVLVRAVPTLVARGDYQTAFSDLIDELASGAGGKSLQEKRRALLTMLSCKNAIKAGDPLHADQIKGLLNDLMQLDNPSICPHGQPILIKISMLELDKKFEREYASR